MSAKENVDVLLEIFAAIERRDAQRVSELCEADVEFSWPPPLPYSGVSRGLGAQRPSWTDTWVPLQPTAAEQTMDPRVVAATDQEVVILWRQKGGVSRGGDRCDSPVLGLYQVHRGRLARAQMFYFDPVGVSRFLATAQSDAA
jgi:ketosteroid isomerase-like protein